MPPSSPSAPTAAYPATGRMCWPRVTDAGVAVPLTRFDLAVTAGLDQPARWHVWHVWHGTPARESPLPRMGSIAWTGRHVTRRSVSGSLGTENDLTRSA